MSEGSLTTNGPLEKPLAPGLYLVGTPIGNLEDITLRALRVLRSVDRIGCEDTRQTAKLLHHFGIQTPMVSYHQHNESSRTEQLLDDLRSGGCIAIVSDAGMPGIADPGATIVAEAIAGGIPVFPVPGANAALTALVAAGLSTERFEFHGFLPSKEGQRKSALEKLRNSMTDDSAWPATHVFYEAPHRILETLGDVIAVFRGSHKIALARELTKLHEEFLRGTAQQVLDKLQARPAIRGEMVLLLDGKFTHEEEARALTVAQEIKQLMQSQTISESDALKRVAKARGIGKSEAYREWQRTRS